MLSRNEPDPVRPALRTDQRRPSPWVGLAPWLLVLVAISAALSACAPPRRYRPDTSTAERLGPDGARDRLRVLIGRAKRPAVHRVDVDAEELTFDWMTSRRVSRLRFAYIESVDVGRGDHTVTIRMSNDDHAYRLAFTTADDAHEVVDLLAWFYRRAEGTTARELVITEDGERL
ncbi:hypothetical protein [Haliangium sp.]|uniref:hypothetical protein n=1 Tax=Haliangium sp. TaxID=2663208 RepID=UPI003D0ECFAB